MKLFSFFVALWMGFLSLFGGRSSAPQPMPLPTPANGQQPSAAVAATTTVAASTSTPTVAAPAESPKNPATTTAQTPASAMASDLPATGFPWQTVLPLGDGRYTTSGPKAGYIYLCHVQSGGEGANGNPTWISGTNWYPSEKVSVEGSVSWPDAVYSMKIVGSTRVITSNGLPTDHPTGIFPIQSSDPAYQFDRNPNSIEAQNYSFSLPVSPTMLETPQCIYGQVGIMNDGVPLFDGFDAEYRDAVAHETQDAWEAHPDENGTYHYHGFEDTLVKDTPVSTVVGFAFDGYPITGPLLPDGTYLKSAQLDECHGITSAVTLDGKTVTTYHYVLTQDFPYSVSCFRGKSYEPKPGGSASATVPSGGITDTNGTSQTPPPAAISACSAASAGSSCSFSAQNGTINGTCTMPPGQSSLACTPIR